VIDDDPQARGALPTQGDSSRGVSLRETEVNEVGLPQQSQLSYRAAVGWLDSNPVAMVRCSSKRLRRPDSLRRKILQPVERKVGIKKQIGWHTFRRTYSSSLAETGNDVKVVQELMRYAKISTTMEVYTQAAMSRKRIAQRKAVDVLFNSNSTAQDGPEMEDSYCSHTVPTKSLMLPDCAR
jgi:hypothetical protein